MVFVFSDSINIIILMRSNNTGNKFKEENLNYLAENSRRAGVITLPCGVQYKVIKQGAGAIPNKSSIVQVYYRGTNINDKPFDSNMNHRSPMVLKVREVILGWQKVIPIMPIGSIYEVTIPFDQGYGSRGVPGIKGFSTLIFTIKLVGIVR